MSESEIFGSTEMFTIAGFPFYAIATLIITLASYFIYKSQQKINALDLLPGPKPLPFIGNAMDLYGTPTEFFLAVRTKFCNSPSGLTRIWIANEPYCLVYSANCVEKILSSQKYIDKSVDYEALKPWLGTGLLTASGSKWQHRRKLLTPTFHFKILEDFIDVFNQQSEIFNINLKKRAEDGKPFDIFNYVTLCTLDIIMESAMGRSINAQDNSNSDYVKAIYEMGTIVIQRQVRPWLQYKFLFKLLGFAKRQENCLRILHGLATETIRQRRKEFDNQKKQTTTKEDQDALGTRKRLAFLDLLLEYSDGENKLSDEDIREEVDTFMFEGHDTTAAGITWSIYLLGSHPEIQEKVFEELDSIFNGSDRPATSADLREMKYLEYCIKEALRLFPSVPMIGRKLKEDVAVDGYTIPNGTSILIVKYCLHRDPRYFPDPEEYKPERFFPENTVKRHPYAYVPFSAGPRNCIGQRFALMEEKAVLSAFLRKYRVESMEKREDLQLTGDLILRPENGTIVKIFPRN